jgi:hypothetical protein
MMSGYSGTVVSTNEIERLIKSLHSAGNIAQLKGFSWAYEGRFFYALTCNSWTRVLDSKTGHWHTRKSYEIDRWRVVTATTFGSRLIGGDFENGQLYVMDANIYTEAGNYLVSEIITPPVHAFPYRLIFNGLFVDAATGVGLVSDDGHAARPKLMVSWSDDGGHSYSAERERDLGTTAEYRRVQPIYRMGKCSNKGRMFKFRISSPVQRVMMSVAVDFDRLGA